MSISLLVPFFRYTRSLNYKPFFSVRDRTCGGGGRGVVVKMVMVPESFRKHSSIFPHHSRSTLYRISLVNLIDLSNIICHVH